MANIVIKAMFEAITTVEAAVRFVAAAMAVKVE